VLYVMKSLCGDGIELIDLENGYFTLAGIHSMGHVFTIVAPQPI
jgi:hypothetical protein